MFQAEALEQRCLMTGSSASLLFDFGGNDVAPGAIPLSIQSYNPAVGYGWTQSRYACGNDSGMGNDPLTRDEVFAQSGTFAVDLPDGEYTVTAYVGNMWGSTKLDSIAAEGRLVASHITTDTGQSKQVSFPVGVSDGQLNLDFTDSWCFYLQGLRIDSSISASAGAAPKASEGTPVTFSGSAFAGADPIYSWDFGDGSTAEGTLRPSHIYKDSGLYTATLKVTAPVSGVSAVSSTKVTVANVAPTPNAGQFYKGTIAAPVAFKGSATDPSPMDTAAGFTYAWNFGDGSTGTGANPAHAYTKTGTYTVTLTATDKDGASASTTTTATIDPYIRDMMVGHMVPNFAASPTILSVRSGAWSDPTTWSLGRVPSSGDIVAITGGTDVTYDLASDTHLDTLAVEPAGKLEFRTDRDTKLIVGNFLVLPNGTLEVGTEAHPIAANVTADIVIADQALDLTMDPEQYGTSLLGFGKVTMVGAPMNTTFANLAAEPHAGDTTLTLAQPVSGWKAGDRLVLPDTRELQWYQRGDYYVPQWEELTLADVSADGRTVTLSAPLKFDHLGARDLDGKLTFLPDVADLTRNVTISSENPDGTRGHTMFMGQADVDIRYVSFHELGRTEIGNLDNTTFDAAKNVTHIGTNQIARYPLHMHYLSGPPQGRGDGYQFTLVGNSVDDGSTEESYKWGIDVHHSSYGLIQDNVVYNTAGAGISTEDGSESYNVFEHNFVVRVNGTGDYFDNNGSIGSGFWFKGPNNYVRDNVAADAYGGIYNVGFDMFAYYTGVQPVPKYPGASTSIPGQYDMVDMNATPLLEFAGNETYGATQFGLSMWWIGVAGATPADVGESVVKDFHTWNVSLSGIHNWPTNHVTIDGYVARGQQFQANGMDFVDYYQKGMVVKNADIQGMAYGIVPSMGGYTMVIQDSYLRNQVDIALGTMSTASYRSDQIPARTTIIRDVRFDTRGVPSLNGQAPLAISMRYDRYTPNPNLVQKDQVFVYDYNGVSGDDFQVYYEEQAADYVVPVSTYNSDGTTRLTAAPVAGLTNQQLWDRYGLAIAGAVAPTNQRRSGIRGLVAPLP